MYDAKVLGNFLRRHREAARLTQEELEKKSGVSSKKISRMEQGFTQDPGFGDVIPVADALGVSPNAVATAVGLWRQHGEQTAKDPRDEYIESWRARAKPEDVERWLDLAYAALLTIKQMSEVGKLPDARQED